MLEALNLRRISCLHGPMGLVEQVLNRGKLLGCQEVDGTRKE